MDKKAKMIIVILLFVISVSMVCIGMLIYNNKQAISNNEKEVNQSINNSINNKEQIIFESEIQLKDYYDYELFDNKVKITSKNDGSIVNCTIPNKLIKASKNDQYTKPLFTFSKIAEQNVIKDNGQFEKRYTFSLMMKLGETEDLSGNIDGSYMDIAKINMEFKYTDSKLNHIKSYVMPKYTGDISKMPKSFILDEAQFGNVFLFDTLFEQLNNLGENTSDYKNDIAGEYNIKDLKIEVSNYRVSSITVTNDKYSTSRGLKVGDTKETALSLYGQPDMGYYENDQWIYYFFRDWSGDGETDILSNDDFRIIFKDNKVSSLELNAYIPID